MAELIQCGFLVAPGVTLAPIIDEIFQVLKVGPVEPARTGDFVRPARCFQAALKIGKDRVRDSNRKTLGRLSAPSPVECSPKWLPKWLPKGLPKWSPKCRCHFWPLSDRQLST